MKRLLTFTIVTAAIAGCLQLAALAADSKPPSTAPVVPPATRPAAPPTTAPVVEVQADGALLMKAEGARIHGFRLRLEPRPVPTLVFWIDPNEYPEWPQAVAKKGTYLVEITYSCPPKAGGEFFVTAAGNKVEAKTETTADWQTFTTVKCGKLNVLNDNTSIAVRYGSTLSKRVTGPHPMINIRSVKLTPTEEDPDAGRPKVKKKR